MEIEADLGQILVAVLSCNLVSHSDFTFVKCLFLVWFMSKIGLGDHLSII